MTLLLAWSLLVPAPLEQPANPAVTPNPAKAPWYFLGVQELLFYADAWLAGVAVPCLIVLGLMALPYLDFNPAGSGYYTIARRPLAYLVFQFGFWQLWILLIVVGTFFRGPNWGFFGPYEVRDPQKLPSMENVPLPKIVDRRSWRSIFWGCRRFWAIPSLHSFRRRMGLGGSRFSWCCYCMLALPLKMLLIGRCTCSTSSPCRSGRSTSEREAASGGRAKAMITRATATCPWAGRGTRSVPGRPRT